MTPAPEESDVEFLGLSVRYGPVTAVDDFSATLAGGKLYGLLGRNGSGKTSLLSVLASLRPASAGSVRVGGREPFEDPAVTRSVCFVGDSPDAYGAFSVRRVFDFAAGLRPNWDAGYAEKLAGVFGLDLDSRAGSLSRGGKSALGLVLGLAARASVTIFDESHLGLDAPSRYAFYDELLHDYLEHPRTVILSTHLIEEVGSLFERVIVVSGGKLLLHEEADALRSRGVAVTGPAGAVDRVVGGLTVLGEQVLGGTKSATVYGDFDQRRRAAARAAGLELGPVPLQDLFVHLTRDHGGNR